MELKKKKIMSNIRNKETLEKELVKIDAGIKKLDEKRKEEDYKDATVFKR